MFSSFPKRASIQNPSPARATGFVPQYPFSSEKSDNVLSCKSSKSIKSLKSTKTDSSSGSLKYASDKRAPFQESVMIGKFFSRMGEETVQEPSLIKLPSVSSSVEKISKASFFDIFIELQSFVSRARVASPRERRRCWGALHMAIKEILEILPVLLDSKTVSLIYRTDRRNFLIRKFRFFSTLCFSACRSALSIEKEEMLAESLLKIAVSLDFDYSESEWAILFASDKSSFGYKSL
jgi:hypothetical protein